MMKDQKYLGDGVYVGHDGHQIWLSVGDNKNWSIALEPEVMENLIKYYKKFSDVVDMDGLSNKTENQPTNP